MYSEENRLYQYERRANAVPYPILRVPLSLKFVTLGINTLAIMTLVLLSLARYLYTGQFYTLDNLSAAKR